MDILAIRLGRRNPSLRRTEFSLKASNCQSLIRQIRGVGRRVGPRTGLRKRSKADKELFCLRRYIATLAVNSRWNYPCVVEMGESPDFMVSVGGVNRGLEITEATTQAFQKELTKIERDRDAVKGLDDGWIGDTPEREWCEAVISAITIKVGIIKNYRAAHRHDILVYSNHPSDFVRGMDGRHPEYERLQMIAHRRAQTWKSESRLGVISVIDGRTLIYDLIGQCVHLKAVDLLVGSL